MDNDEIGEMLRAARDKLNISQVEMARLVGVTQSMVSNWESGRHRPHLHKVRAVACGYNIPLSRLIP